MIEISFQFLVSAACIVFAGVFLVQSADTIAEKTKMSRLLVGSLFLAGATSLPELLVDASAVRNNMPDLAVGDLMGSSLSNLLILAVADILYKNKGKLFSRASRSHALMAALSINVSALAGIAILLGEKTKSIAIGNLGVGPLVIVLAYLLGLRLVFYDQKNLAENSETVPLSENRTLYRSIVIYLISALTILIAAPFLAESAGKIAETTGLGNTFIGTTLLALCTSLPELVSTLFAVKKGAFDLAIGNIFGSNSFNMVLLLPLDLLQPGPLLSSVSSAHILTCLATIFATSVAAMGQLYRVEKRKILIDPDAFAVISIVVGALWLLYILQMH